MEPIAITSRGGRIWKTAGLVWLLSTAVFALFALGDALVDRALPKSWEWVVVGTVPVGLALAWLAYVWLTSGSSARRLAADGTGVTIERPDGRLVVLRWDEIRGVEFNSVDEEILVLRTSDARN